jgi:hypothetical protein
MGTLLRFDSWTYNLCSKVYDLRASGDTLKVALSNVAPSPLTMSQLSQITQIAATNGYTAGGVDVQNDIVLDGSTRNTNLIGVSPVWTATGGSMPAFRYPVLYDDTTPSDLLIGYWDIGESLVIASGEHYTLTFYLGIICVVLQGT